MSEVLYTASVTSTGGGRDGRVASPAGDLALDVRPPKDLGGAGDAANPELLFAAAWSSCFNGALHLVMKQSGVDIAAHAPAVTAEVDLEKDPADGGYRLSGRIQVTFENADSLDDAAALVAKAHEVCPYSKAVGGNFRAEVGVA